LKKSKFWQNSYTGAPRGVIFFLENSYLFKSMLRLKSPEKRGGGAVKCPIGGKYHEFIGLN
jgi:hypothetical protein